MSILSQNSRTIRIARFLGAASIAVLATSNAFAQDAKSTDAVEKPADDIAATSPATTAEAPATAASDAIVVTGYRGSLQSALNAKRRSTVQMDEIKATDIANFPDSNLAEALQRLPGVSIDRDNGDGRGITVRGLGGDFNRTRLNGLEALSTAGSSDSGTAPNRSRSFDFNTFASELFSSLKVQKSASAETDEGSLGATLDLTTARPFDYKHSTIAASAQASYQELSKKTSPRLAGLVSTRFADDKMGILISAAYSESENSIDQYRRQVGAPDYLYRGTQWAGNENPNRAGFSAPTGTTFGTAITNPLAIAAQTGSDPVAYAKLFPGAPYNTPGLFNDSLVKIPSLLNLEQRDTKNDRLGVTGSYQWQISSRTLLTIDGAYSRYHNETWNNQIQTVGLNRNNTATGFNTATNTATPIVDRALYPGLCVPSAGSAILPAQDCGSFLYGSAPAFSTALSSANASTGSVLGAAAVVAGGTNPSNANIFSSNPYNLDPYDYYNNPNSVGYVPSAGRLAGRAELIGRPAVDVLDANVTNGLADYLVLRNVDFRSAVDYSGYVTEFYQGSARIDHEFSDDFKASFLYGKSRSTNNNTGILVEFNRMDSPGNFVYDERAGGDMPIVDLGFDAANPANWDTVKGFSAIRVFKRSVQNDYEGAKADFDWQINPEVNLGFGANWRKFGFTTHYFERNNDLLNPTLKEAGVNASSIGQTISFGQGIQTPAGTVSSFYVPTIQGFQNTFDFTCNCINKWGDWRLTDKRNGGNQNYSVNEDDKGFYAQMDWDSTLFGRHFTGNFGTRVAITEVASDGTSPAGLPIAGSNKYTDWLPSVNLNYEPIDDVMVRFATSRVIARPLLANLSPSITAISVPNDGSTTGATLTVGNPKLNPFRSVNYDASVEWYFGKGGLLSVALFEKDISSFPQTLSYSGTLSSFTNADGIAAIRSGFSNASQLAYIDGNYTFTARQYGDAPGGYVRGFEVNWQQNFTFLPGFLKNLGMQLNYTYIDSQLNYILDPGNVTTGAAATYAKAPFLGVSPHSINGTLFYETDKFSARVSGAYREGFADAYPIAAGACSPGLIPPLPATGATQGTACDAPLMNDFTYRKATLNIDAVISYELIKGITARFEALNLTNQADKRYAYQGQNAVSLYAATGRVFRFGIRGKF